MSQRQGWFRPEVLLGGLVLTPKIFVLGRLMTAIMMVMVVGRPGRMSIN